MSFYTSQTKGATQMDHYSENEAYPNELDTIDAEELMATPYIPQNFIVKELIPEGLTLFCGPSKIGKSWLALQLCLCVSLGNNFLGFETTKCDVLYLALEDSFARIKNRVAKITEECPANLRFAIQAGPIGDTLEEQLDRHKALFSGTRLVVIDTLQKVRGIPDSRTNSMAYAKDYAEMSFLKRIADKHSLALVVVHHVRKLRDKDDPFNEIAGTTGLMGAADTVLLLNKHDRTAEQAEFLWTGRDVQSEGIQLRFTDCIWEPTGDKVIPSSDSRSTLPPIVRKTCEYLKRCGFFRGTASELLTRMGEPDVKPNVLTRSLSGAAYDYLRQEGIYYDSGRSGNCRWLELTYMPGDDSDASDANDDYDANIQ